MPRMTADEGIAPLRKWIEEQEARLAAIKRTAEELYETMREADELHEKARESEADEPREGRK